jgi:hypothetical protein
LIKIKNNKKNLKLKKDLTQGKVFYLTELN